MDINVKKRSNIDEINNKEKMINNLKNTKIPNNELLNNLGIFTNRQSLARILCMIELYKKILDKHGIIIELGVRWGQNMCLFTMLKGIYEPYNYNRKIIGFDTFKGFSGVCSKDKNNNENDYSVSLNYKNDLQDILNFHIYNNPINHICKSVLIEGDACNTLKTYLQENKHTLISFVYFDFDIYKPTYECLKLILPHLTKGAIIAFDELNDELFPGETLALKEVLDINKYEIKRFTFDPLISYIEFNK